MQSDRFSKVAILKGNPKWEYCISRQESLYKKRQDIRNEFERDYTRILHCTAYRRLKHKTQVFFATKSDHICTRIEHVNHVASVSYTIAKFLGLNTQLTAAIAIGHDLGHAPFGHAGEKVLKQIAERELGEKFWHEKNSLRFVDKCETLPDTKGKERNLNLTYGVRDGIISHCGEVNENSIFPRNDMLDLNTINEPSKYPPYTWEGCIVKIADKISYLGRDIEDALALKILSYHQLRELRKIIKFELRKIVRLELREINNTILMHNFIMDLCKNSSPENGICFSKKHLKFINLVKDFNYKNIYEHQRLTYYKDYANLIINTIYRSLKELYKGEKTLDELRKFEKLYPQLGGTFSDWLLKYSDLRKGKKGTKRYENEILYKIESEQDYIQAIIDFISGMTDSFSINVFNELTSF